MSDQALVIDDHPLYRGALATVARGLFGDLHVIEADSTEAGLSRASRLDALRLVLLDFRLPGMNGAEAVQAFRRRFPSAAVIVVSASEDRRELTAATRAGAHAFLSKTCSMEVLTDAIRTVLAGGQPDPRWSLAQSNTFSAASVPELTARQREILALLCLGLSNKEISLRLDLALITVKIHVSQVFRVLGVLNRTQAVLAARRLGLDAGAPYGRLG